MSGTILAGGIGGPFAGAIYAWTMSDNACRTDLLASTGAGLSPIAGAISYAQSSYAKELSQGASWYLTGGITAGEFIALLLTYCRPGELIGLLAGAGFSLYYFYNLFQCGSIS